MASIARVVRPVASRFAARSGLYAACPIRAQAPAIRAFSVSSSAQVKKYTTEHEWIELSADGKTGTIGISDYAAHALGDVVYVELPSPLPMSVSAGDSIGAVESVKSASDINSPISCDIVEVNALLEEKPGTINRSPEDGNEGGGWIAKVQVTQEAVAEMDALMDDAAYKEFTESE